MHCKSTLIIVRIRRPLVFICQKMPFISDKNIMSIPLTSINEYAYDSFISIEKQKIKG